MPAREFTVDATNLKRIPSYQPLLLMVSAMAVGILIDRFSHLSPALILICFVAAIVVWGICFKCNKLRISGVALLIATTILAAGWHHYWWNYYGVNDIGFFAQSEPQPACIEGTICREPDLSSAPISSVFDPIPRRETTRLILRASRICQARRWIEVSGQVDCLVIGHVSGLTSGTQVRIYGRLSEFKTPTNPGEFDFNKHARTDRKLARMTASLPDAVEVISSPQSLIGRLATLRSTLDRIILEFVGPQRAPLASAILLGNREQLDRVQQESYLVSGTIHLLAISGLHVGILAGGFFFLSRLGCVPRKYCLLATILFVVCYAWLVEFRTPVVRASILITVVCLSKWFGRANLSFNSLGGAALIVLLINPTELMNVGAQLSFLAVATLAHFYPYFVKPPTQDPLDRLIERTRPIFQRSLRAIYERCRLAVCVSAVVWGIALPLVAERFNIVAPIALVINPLLIPPLTTGLLCGFAVMMLGPFVSPLATIFGIGCDLSLLAVESMVSFAESIPGGHYWTAGPNILAVITFYGGLFLFVFFPPTRLPRRWCWTLLVVWISGLVVLPRIQHWQHTSDRQGLVCTFVDVGHGTSVLLQFPNGRNVLYDCGSFTSSLRATHSISGVLWHEQIHHIDMIVLSHTDVDHYNGLPGLLKRFSIGQVVISPPMASPDEVQYFRELLDQVRRNNIAIDVVSKGNRIRIDDSVNVVVQNPPELGTGGDDNSNSIVLEVQFGQFTVWLPGDLSGPGLEMILEQPPRHYDVVMAPHHGSRFSYPEKIVDWCQPDLFVVSGKSTDVNLETSTMLDQRGVPLRHTGLHGAIRITMKRNAIVEQFWNEGSWTDPHEVANEQ